MLSLATRLARLGADGALAKFGKVVKKSCTPTEFANFFPSAIPQILKNRLGFLSPLLG